MEKILSTSRESRNENGRTTYMIRESYGEDDSKTLRVEEVENGFIVSIEHSYYEKEGEERHYKCDEKKYISTDNPLEKIQPPKEKKKESDASELLGTISSFMATMTNKIMV